MSVKKLALVLPQSTVRVDNAYKKEEDKKNSKIKMTQQGQRTSSRPVLVLRPVLTHL
jgi:hypothetical protein